MAFPQSQDVTEFDLSSADALEQQLVVCGKAGSYEEAHQAKVRKLLCWVDLCVLQQEALKKCTEGALVVHHFLFS